MRFILSVILATALLGAVATADVHHGQQQAAFRLEPRNNHHSHHRRSISKRQPRDLSNMFNSPAPEENGARILAAAAPETAQVDEKKISNFGLHHKKNSHHKHKSSSKKHHKRAMELHRKNHSHHSKSSSKKHHKRALELHRKNHSHHNKASGSCSHEKRALELHRKNHSHHNKASGSCSHEKRALELHRKNHSHHSKASGSCNHEKRAVADKKNVDAELAFHRRISRSRKSQHLREKKNKRAVEPETLVKNDQEFTAIRAQELQIESQDIKKKSAEKHKEA